MTAQELLHAVRRALLDRRVAAGHWEGRLSSSALATATAVTALAVARTAGVRPARADDLIARGIDWLLWTRGPDGGWGDTPDSVSNISTTALVWAALNHHRTVETDAAAKAAERWIASEAGGASTPALASALARRYGEDRTFSVPILTMCAISGRLGPAADAWRLVPQLPFELAAFPRRWFSRLRLPVVSYALPALISMGLAHHRLGRGLPILHGLRERVAPRVLRTLETLQPPDGGFLEAIPLTAFVVMSLIAAGEMTHQAVARGLDFLVRSARDDGSWAIDSNLATWVTTLAVNALAAGRGRDALAESGRREIREWLLGQQWRVEHPYTGAAAGGWAWTDLPGGVPDADDTAGALVALKHLGSGDADVRAAAIAGARWLLDLQNSDGGIPTFCRGWGTLPFDRSTTDLTAHALRAWAVWRDALDPQLRSRVAAATRRGLLFLARAQRPDGSFVPLWFGNQAERHEQNPVVGTSRVLAGLAAVDVQPDDVRRLQTRGTRWLCAVQNADGGWGGTASVPSSIEETALAIGGLVPAPPALEQEARAAVRRGLSWLARATDDARRFPPAPIGLYFARLWYSEELYPIVFTAAACETAAARGWDQGRAA